MPYRSCTSSSVLLEIGEELAVESSCVYANESERMTYFLMNCETNQEQPCGLRHPLFVSRQEMSVENLIDNIVTSFLRRTKELERARYRGSWDYESTILNDVVIMILLQTDVHHIDDQSICTIIIVCICEIELPMKDLPLNYFFVTLQFLMLHSPFNPDPEMYSKRLQHVYSYRDIINGLSFGGKCHVMRELPQKNLFNPSLWYPFEKFPVEKEVHSFNIRCEEVYFGECKTVDSLCEYFQLSVFLCDLTT
uniref:DUF1985 domain-containing protein n=1 Tax=Angiostrongylus cantonensis TaxID=6313 RepID=A0A0K0DRQ8_ANGCA